MSSKLRWALPVALVGVVGAACLLLWQSHASARVHMNYAHLNTIQKRIVSETLATALGPQPKGAQPHITGPISGDGRGPDSAPFTRPRWSGSQSGATSTINYFPSYQGNCPASLGNDVKVNQNCLNLSDPDLQGYAQANNNPSIAVDPFNPWHLVASDTNYVRGDSTCGSYFSLDGGRTWSDVGPEISLFPTWTEMYGASNPHRLSDGRLLWAVIGTVGRDVEWQSGVTFSDANGDGFTSPVLIGAAADRNFADTDLVRLRDGRFLAVMREMITRQSHQSWSSDEGRTWTPIRPTGFRGSNTKLFPLRSGAVLCAYRDEDPARRGVSLSLTEDGGETWRFAGQLYAAPADARHLPGSVCGYPDIVSLGSGEIAAVVHSYPGPDGRMSIQFLRLRDRS